MSLGSTPNLSASLLAWLRCFEAAARCGSFTKAAQELHVSQGAVSQQVKKLEDRLGHALLRRTPGGLQLTAAGEQLFAATRESLRGLESALSRLHAQRLGEPVNVSCSPSFAMLWLTLRLGSLYRAHPHLALRVVGESERIDPVRMARDGIAAAVRFSEADAREASAVELLDEWLLPVAAPAFMEANPQLRDPAKLQGAHLLHSADPLESGELTQEWMSWLNAAGVKLRAGSLRQGTQFGLSLLAVQAALGGQGIALARLALVQHYLVQGRLVAPYKLRVRSLASYHFIGSPSHPEAPTILAWLLDETALFRQKRDAWFTSEGITSP